MSTLGFVFSMYTPWWSLILMAAAIAFVFPSNNINAFLSGFLGVGLLWLIMAWKIDVETESVLSVKVAELLMMDDTNMLVLLSGIIGAFAGGLGAFTGNSFRQLFLRKKKESFYS
ncbi:hypothetical protein [Reichenbachiella versicolor]|uniref:hypothetical protein n=1 Tax=Reichenbachiella versicolor TaxID=1821036 RepID=UPI0013A56E57|nr:hypothetical protein [Reichenbachiella versicolor]